MDGSLHVCADNSAIKLKFNFYSKTNQMHNISNLLYFGTTLHMFQMVSLSIIRSLRLYIHHQVYVTQVLWLLAIEPAWYDAICTALDS